MPESDPSGDLRRKALVQNSQQYGHVDSGPASAPMPELVPEPVSDGRHPTAKEAEQQGFYRRQAPQVAVQVALDWSRKEFSAVDKQNAPSRGGGARGGEAEEAGPLAERRGHAKEVMNAWERVNRSLTRASAGQDPILTWDAAEKRPKFLEHYINAQRLLETYTQAYRSQEAGQGSIAQAARQSLDQVVSKRAAQGMQPRQPTAPGTASPAARSVHWAPGTKGGPTRRGPGGGK